MKTEFTNMVMVTNPKTGEVAVIDRKNSWCGPAFPGGHVEDAESFYDSAVREMREETGLCVKSLESCGIIQWIHAKTGDRYVVMCYRTSDFEGDMPSECDEGRLLWVKKDELSKMPTENDFLRYLPMFTGNYCEAVGHYDESGNIDFKYL